MTTEKKCLRCGSVRLEPGVLHSTGRVHFRAAKTRIMSFPSSDVTVKASICLDCGSIELIGEFQKTQPAKAKAKPA